MNTKIFNERTDRVHSVKSISGSEIFSIGDKVFHEGSKDDNPAEITGFYWDEEYGEFRANTTKGNAGIDYLYKY